MTRGNWFTTNVIGKICQKLYVRLDHDFPFATLKSVCVEDQHGRVVFTVPSTCVHKPLPAGWLTSSHVFRGHLELLFGKNQLVKDFRFWQFFRACVSQTRETTRSYVILLLFPACLLSLLVPRLPQADFTFQWLSRGCSSNSRGPWFPNTPNSASSRFSRDNWSYFQGRLRCSLVKLFTWRLFPSQVRFRKER